MKVSILIPAYNEEKSIKKCIESCLNQSAPVDEVVIVNDGSSDDTLKILKSIKEGSIKIVDIKQNTGNKSLAQEIGLKHVFGDFVLTTDADTVLDKNFVRNALPRFQEKNVSAVAGYVKSLKNNWITAAREIDYVIGQAVYKTAQDFINYLLVIPGCAAMFRVDHFRKHIVFSHDTVTEDLDFTYQLHQKGLRIVFEKRSIVYTQDPPNIPSYIRQMKRWYGGGWQNLLKHMNIIFRKPGAALELSLTYIEGLIAYLLLLLIPIINFSIFLERVLPLYIIMIAIFAAIAAIKDRRIDLFLSFPGYILLTYINAFIFISQFIKEALLQRRTMIWLKADRTRL